MIGNVARGMSSRCLPVLLAVLLAVAGGSHDGRPKTGPAAAVSGERHSVAAEQASDSAAGNTATAVAVTDREHVLTAQNTVSVGVSRAPPVTAV